ncbi:MAG TPA: ATP-binding protein [Longimicrobiales bacterium]|nr:ATP-binding protein [Longimicrobiales bacterium]
MRRPDRRYIFCFAALLVTAAPEVRRAEQEPLPVRVLMVYAHDNKAPGVVAFVHQLHAVVSTEMPRRVEFYDEFLDFDHFPNRERWPHLARFIAEKYRGLGFDAIVAEGSLALRFAAEHLRGHFPGLPVVYGLQFEPVVDFAALPADVTGTRLEFSFAATFKLARSLQPDAERVVLVGGAAAMDSVLMAAAVREIRPFLGGLELIVLQNWTYDSLLESLRELPPRTMVILSSFRRDRRGQKFNSGDLIASLTRVSPVPVYGIARNWVGDGIVGGSVMEFGDNGTQTGRMLVRVLRRAPGTPVPAAEVAAAPLVVDWRQLGRWKFSERALPPGTQVLFRTSTVWERYRTGILIALLVFIAQSVLIALLLLERKRRINAQRALEDQVAYEQMIAELTLDTVRNSPAERPGAFTAALAHIGEYAGATAAVLNVRADADNLPQTRFVWSNGQDRSTVEASELAQTKPRAQLEIPLVAESRPLGSLELTRVGDAGWPAGLATRLGAASELIAGALARARAARALEETRGQVAHMGRVATMGELAAAVSHELRQPLSAIRANAEAGALVLAKASPDLAMAREIFQDIVNDDVRASQVIDHLRMLLRKEKPTTASVDLNSICRHAVQLLAHEATFRRIRLELALESELPPVSGDAVQLQQVVLNLTLNAMDATATADARQVLVRTAVNGAAVEISVRDTGPGLQLETQSHLFESFFSTKPHGLGMGLAIVRSIVEWHHGLVRGENDPAGGAVFSVLLPMDPG